MRRAGGRAVVADGEAWGALWRDHQNRYFEAHGLGMPGGPDRDARAASTSARCGCAGPNRGSSSAPRLLRQANEAAARDPAQVLATLTRHNATFTERDLDRHLAKHIADDGGPRRGEGGGARHAKTLPLHDRTTGEAAERYTTKTVRAQEQAALPTRRDH